MLLLLEWPQQSHLCWADCQLTVCDTGESRSVRGGLRVVRQTTHQQANSSLMFSSVFIASRANWSALHCYWEQREKHKKEKTREIDERQKEKRQWQNSKKLLVMKERGWEEWRWNRGHRISDLGNMQVDPCRKSDRRNPEITITAESRESEGSCQWHYYSLFFNEYIFNYCHPY